MTNMISADSNIFSFPIRVYYEDTDAGGVVYHANYLNFFERARTEWLRNLGYEQDALRLQEKIIFAVRNVEVSYLKPAFFNDQLIATVKVISIGRSRIEIAQQIIRHQQNEVMEILSTATILIVCIDADRFKLKKIPDHIRLAITPNQL